MIGYTTKRRTNMTNRFQQAKALMKDQQFQKAQTLLHALLNENPHEGSILFTLACTHDATGEGKIAINYYNRALEQPLSLEERRKALIQLGSTYRALGDYPKAKEILEKAKEEFPEEPVIDVFYAMVLHNLNQHEEAFKLLLKKVVQINNDEGIEHYQKALTFYADHLNETWEV